MKFPVHVTEYHKLLESPEFKAFLAEYRELCKKHNLCILGGYDRDVVVGGIEEGYWTAFVSKQNCYCEECQKWWESKNATEEGLKP